jgi:hypothetical membrane protein
MLSSSGAQRFPAVCGLLAGPTLVLGWVAGGLAQPDDYSLIHYAVSDAGAETADSAWLANQIGDNLTGLILVVFAIGLRRSLGSHRSARIGAFLIALTGGALFLVGLFPVDCRAIDAGCDKPWDSWHGTAHGIAAAIATIAFLLAPFALARALQLAPRWRGFWVPTLGFGIGTIAALLVGGVFGQGLSDLLSAVVWLAWVAVLVSGCSVSPE